MSRNHTSAKKAGARFERAIADYLATALDDDRIDRRVTTGTKDRGDITGLQHMGGRVVLELKDYGGRFLLGPWLREAEIERGNDDALVGAVVIKRRGITDPADQVVAMTVRDLVALMSGVRP